MANILISEKGHRFDYYVRALRGQFKNNLADLIFECNKSIFSMRKNPTNLFKPIVPKKIKTGMFYIIRYNFNSNKLYIPCLSIDYRISENNKHNLYIINLDYLPFGYKTIFFNEFYNRLEQIFEFNANTENVNNEKSLPIKFESVYKSLKDNGEYHFAISALDLNKIEEVYVVSTNLMYIMIHVHMRSINIALMKDLMDKYDKGSDANEQLNTLINELEQMTIDYDNDIKDYYKKLRNLESNYKLFENI